MAKKYSGNLDAGDIICVRGESLIGKIIRWVTESNVSHVALYIGNGLVIESTLGFGVRILPIDYYTEDPTVEVYAMKVKTPFDVQKLIAYSYTFFGRKYDLFGQIGILTKALSKKYNITWIHFWGKNLADEGKRVWCSEFIGRLFITQNIQFSTEDISYLSPGDIYNSSVVDHIL